jgi:hypothetical protein
MTSTQHLWAPIPTTVTSTGPISNSDVADSISHFLQIHHGELPGDSNATASLVRLIQGLRDETLAVKEEASPVKSSKKKRKRDKVEADASQVAEAAEPAVDASTVLEGVEPAKKKKRKDKKKKET